MVRSNFRKPARQQRIARERISGLFVMAQAQALIHPELADRYVLLARRLGMRYKVSLAPYKRLFCAHCGAFGVAGRTVRVRIHRGRLIRRCMRCNQISRFPLLKPQVTKK